ncbi:unnamed protein product [Triticum turgidum subsp. durum]|uniref:Uncharacterized protein n=1 Tax=Triticum turgidum subsp. durum TaxID=4567 RepID=A0A9R0XA67_TRITD|nr:unnamed protein product [Triticum turgidum subsp. durum]
MGMSSGRLHTGASDGCECLLLVVHRCDGALHSAVVKVVHGGHVPLPTPSHGSAGAFIGKQGRTSRRAPCTCHLGLLRCGSSSLSTAARLAGPVAAAVGTAGQEREREDIVRDQAWNQSGS